MRLRKTALAAAIVGTFILFAAPASGDGHLRRAASPNVFGPLVGADSLDNFQIGGPKRGVFAYRFRAPWTGTVASVKFFAILNTEERPTGYSGGTGGTFRVSLVADVDGTPGRDVLAQAAYAPTRANLFPRLRFPAPAPVERGRYYAIVFTNIDENPVENFASINTLYVDPATDARPRSIPADVSMLWADGATDLETPIAWTRDPVGGDGHFPVVDIAGGEPGQHLGYGYMEIWSENAKPIGGPASVRQRFTFDRVSPARVRNVWIRLRRTSDSAAPLRISLETPDGRLLATALSAANRIREDRPGWVTVTFPGAPILRPRQTVALVLRAGSERAYEAYPVRDGSLFGFTAATVFPEGYAQFTSAGGWKGWDQWGKYDRHDGDLQFGLGLTRVVP